MGKHQNLSDNDLLTLLTESDHSAYTELYNRYFPLVYMHVHKKLMDKDQAKDVVQEIFAGLWFKRDSAATITNIPAYLITSARNKIFDLFAHEQIKQKHYDALQEFFSSKSVVPTDHAIREAQLKAYIEQQIAALPPKMRMIFELSRKEQLSHKEIAEKLGTSENNISTQITTALRILRTKLGTIAFVLLFLHNK